MNRLFHGFRLKGCCHVTGEVKDAVFFAKFTVVQHDAFTDTFAVFCFQ